MNREMDSFLNDFAKAPIVGILRGLKLETCLEIAKAYQTAGLKYLEVTMNTESCQEIISTLATKFPSLVIGAGTVCTLVDYTKAIEAGSSFIVTPIVDLAVIKKAQQDGIPIFVGAYTPTEIFQAWQAGATAVKVFPASALGSSYIKNVLGPLNRIKLLPTGGISISNLKEYLDAGAIGVGMGSTLFPNEILKLKNWNALEKHFEDVLGEALR